MGKTSKLPGKQSHDGDMVFMDQFHEGSQGPITVMVCRKWDVFSMNGPYISTDHIISDKKGNVMHCMAKNKIAHRFADKFEEGGLYVLKDFKVVPNTENYRILKDAAYIMQLQWSTTVKKATDDVTEFNRYPFELVAFEDLEPTDSKYFVDVIGYVTIVGKPTKKSNGNETVEFNLTNEKGQQVRVTLWGQLGNDMVAKKEAHAGPYTILLTCMSVKPYLGNLCLSSSSSTLIIDDDNNPVVKTFKSVISGLEIVDTGLPLIQVKANIKTLKELLDWGRNKGKKEVGAFQNSVEITGVRTRVGWFNFTCTKGKCRKGVNPNPKGLFWCDSCKADVKYPRPRYRIELDITDGTANIVVVLFDEPGEKLLGRTTQALVSESGKDESGDATVMPNVLRELIGTTHVFEIKSHTYYQVGEYESFNCAEVVIPEEVVLEMQKGVVGNSNCNGDSAESSSKSGKRVLPITTPVKLHEGGKKDTYDDDSDSGNLEDGGIKETVTTSFARSAKKASCFVRFRW